jgi:hypothetical protein
MKNTHWSLLRFENLQGVIVDERPYLKNYSATQSILPIIQRAKRVILLSGKHCDPTVHHRLQADALTQLPKRRQKVEIGVSQEHRRSIKNCTLRSNASTSENIKALGKEKKGCCEEVGD